MWGCHTCMPVVIVLLVGHSELCGDVLGEQRGGTAGVRDNEPDPAAMSDHEAGMS
jgi:hypothetical protein